MKKIILITIIMFMFELLLAQSDYYDNSGKIYAVVAVVVITLLGIAGILVYLERRIKNLEKSIDNE